jgi:hypothetical protein
MLPSHQRALRDLAECRTESLGGHLAVCDHCGLWRYSYHSCRNRSCPKCHGSDTKKWLDERRGELLAVPYFHLVFTLPQELHGLFRTHQRILYAILIRAAASSLMRLARDPRYVGGTIAVLCVLHTWTRALLYHPHIHCLVPGGGLSDDGGSWLTARKRFLVPVRPLSEIFRATFMQLARKALPDQAFPESVWHTPWVVYSKPTIQGTEKVLAYLARYVHRIAITNNRILAVKDDTVTFRYKDSRQQRWKLMTLSALEFMRRFLQHVLPAGFHKVRFYGLLAPGSRGRLPQIRELLLSSSPKSQQTTSATPDRHPAQENARPSTCPQCQVGSLVVVLFLPYRRRAPP